MNNVQRNFRNQMKQIEQEKKQYWRKETYHDRFDGKTYIRYYDQNNHLLKTEPKKAFFKSIGKVLATLVALIAIVAVFLLFYCKFGFIIY